MKLDNIKLIIPSLTKDIEKNDIKHVTKLNWKPIE